MGQVACLAAWLGQVVGMMPQAFTALRMPAHNPEHSCPEARQVEWPLVKAQVMDYSRSDERSRRGFESPDELFNWRMWVAKVYISEDLDFCPLGVQAVHFADVDRRLAEFNATALGEVLESQIDHFLSRVPIFLSVLSGWPIFRMYGQAAEVARKLLVDLPPRVAAEGGVCGGFVDAADLHNLARQLLQPHSAPTQELLVQLAHILSDVERSGHGANASDAEACHLADAFAHFAQAYLLGRVDASGGSAKGVELYLGRVIQAVENGESAFYRAVRAASQSTIRPHALLRVFASEWPIWPLLAELQVSMDRPPWALVCSHQHQLAAGAAVHWQQEHLLCPACSIPNQAEWYREMQWVKALAASGARGELGLPEGEALMDSVLTEPPDEVPPGRLLRTFSSGGAERAEAWATLLSDDDAAASQSGSWSLAVYLEVVRVMARSVRRWERGKRRPFLVLVAASAMTDEVRAALEGDELTPLVLPTFASEGIRVPLRQKQRGDLPPSPANPSSARGGEEASFELSWWMKIRLWALTQYRRIVYLDADVLVWRPIDELFALPDEVLLAAPAHPSNDGKGAELSVGVMSLRPDEAVYEALTAFLAYAAPWLQTGVRSVDQLLQQTFFARHFAWMGHPRWDPETADFLGCHPEAPKMHGGVDVEAAGGGPPPPLRQATQGLVCVLPARYDFCVTYTALVASVGTDQSRPSRQMQDDISAQFATPQERAALQRRAAAAGAPTLPAGPGRGWREPLRAKLLHWTGPRRKPWLHWLPLACTPFDGIWWDAHEELCEEAAAAAARAPAGSGPTPRPCRVACDGRWSPLAAEPADG